MKSRIYTPHLQQETSVPSSDGCFVQIWDLPEFRGVFDYVNGPIIDASLRNLPGGRKSYPIRSVKVAAAAVTLYGAGTFVTLAPNSDYSNLPDALSGNVESVTVLCEPGPPVTE